MPVVVSLLRVQIVAALAVVARNRGTYMYIGTDSCSSCSGCEKRDKYTDGYNQSNKH